MSLAAGTRLGPYEVLGLIGAGGMGEVYRVRDERLQRSVAIKIVGGTSVTTSDERARLLAEARAASALNHPNICAVYEVGQFEGLAFIVMELVEGRPLSERVPHEGLPAETVIRYGIQVADALAHAHASGVVHRDLKTANIVVNAQGSAKILDFGLAHRIQPPPSDAATASVEVAESAVLTGTIAYVPPEALLGQATDTRADIWSLGVVLYEIATGHLPFTGRNSFDLTAAILRAAPARFPAHVTPAIRAVITRCLAKEPSQRYQHAGEVRAALEAIGSDVAALPAVPAPKRGRRLLAAGGAAAVIAAVTFGAWQLLRRDRGTDWEQYAVGARMVRISASEEPTFGPSLSPDGRMVCYVQQAADGHTDVYVGRIAGGARIRLTNDPAVEESPRFSADGELVAFTRVPGPDLAPEVRVVPALGGDPVSTISGGSSPAWSRDGRLAYVRREEGGRLALVVSAADGTNPTVILPPDGVYWALRSPAWSPDGRYVVVVRSTGGAAGEMWLVPARAGQPRRLVDEPATTFSESPAFTPDGRGVIHSSNRGGATNLWILPLNGARPVRLTTGPGPDESPSVATDGSIAFLNSRSRGLLQAYDHESGGARTLLAHSPYVWGPAISPDGKEIAFSQAEVDGSWHIWSMPMSGGAAHRLTSGDGGELYPRWSPDSAHILFHTWNVPRRFGRVARAGGRTEWLHFGGEGHDSFADLSPDGRQVAFVRADEKTERIYVAGAEGGSPRLLTSSPGTVPSWSPDGRAIAFSATRLSGGVFTINADGTDQRQLTQEGSWPVWWPDGTRIGYLALDARGNQQLRVVRADGDGARPLAHIRLAGLNHPFDIAPDGRTIVVSNSEHVLAEIWLLERRQ